MLFFRNNIVIICTAVKKGLSPSIFPLYTRHLPDDGRSGQLKHIVVYNEHVVKGKAIPLQTWTDPEGSRRLRLPDFKIIGT